MHGLIFETSIWLLAGSTRLLQHCQAVCNHTFSWHKMHMVVWSLANGNCMFITKHENALEFFLPIAANKQLTMLVKQCPLARTRTPMVHNGQAPASRHSHIGMRIHLTSFPMGNNAIKHPNTLAIVITNTLTPDTNLPIGKIGIVNEIVNKQNAIFRRYLT